MSWFTDKIERLLFNGETVEEANARFRRTLADLRELQKQGERLNARRDGVPDDVRIVSLLEMHHQVRDGLLAAICPRCSAFVLAEHYQEHERWHNQ